MASEPQPEPSLDFLGEDSVEGEAALCAALRGHVPTHDDDRRAETLIERLRQTLPLALTASEDARPMPEMLEYFRLEHALGGGGMGTVYRAFDTRLQRPVAVKVLRPRLARDARYRERFVREARAASALEHPNIVPTHYVGEAFGVPFLVMPLLHGLSLHTWLQQQEKPPPLATTLHIVRQLASGLQAFHLHGMVHRDVKPSNIWLETTADGTVSTAKLLDFGLARAVHAEQPLTETGAILGTPAYMAPEQARGQTVDARADLFSLGCVLYQLLTLHQAFRGPDPLAILLSLAVDTPVRPTTLNPACPPALAKLCMELLAKEPEHRPPSVQHVLDRLMINDAAHAPSRGRRGVVMGLALTTLLLVAGTYYVATNKGMLVIETDDPAVKITLEDAGGKITILDPTRQQTWRIDTGTYQVRVDGAERTIDLPNPFIVRRGETVLAKVRPVKRPLLAAPTKDRAIAEKFLQLGATVTVEQAQKATLVKHARDLPAGDVLLLEVNFFGNATLQDRDLAILEHAPELWNVNLSHTKIGDAGLKHLLGLPKLHSLSLDGSQVTNAGLPLLKECTELRGLGLSFSKVDAKGLEHLHALPALESLGLCGLDIRDADLMSLQKLTRLRDLALDLCPITDDGLAHLKPLEHLKRVGLVTTKVTLAGAKKFATVLPQCRIILEGHTLEPLEPTRNRE